MSDTQEEMKARLAGYKADLLDAHEPEVIQELEGIIKELEEKLTQLDLNSELDEMIQQTAVSVVGHPLRREAEVDELDQLLAESVMIRDEAVATKNLREQLKRKAKMTGEERREIESKIREWEARNVWDTKAVVAVFEKVSCDCGFYTEVFSHLMHRQVHKHTPATTRMVVTETFDDGLPKEVARQISHVFICAECGPDKGWKMDDAEVMEWNA